MNFIQQDCRRFKQVSLNSFIKVYVTVMEFIFNKVYHLFENKNVEQNSIIEEFHCVSQSS